MRKGRGSLFSKRGWRKKGSIRKGSEMDEVESCWMGEYFSSREIREKGRGERNKRKSRIDRE